MSLEEQAPVQKCYGNDDLPWLYTQPLQNIGGAIVCIVLGKWVCQTFIYEYIVTKYECNSLKYIISQGGLYYFTFNIRLLIKFWMWSKIESNFGPNVTIELLVRWGSESGRFLVWQFFRNGFLFFCKVFLPEWLCIKTKNIGYILL
jgi:hypothetical protein